MITLPVSRVAATADAEAAVAKRLRCFEAIGDPEEARVNADVFTGLAYVQSHRRPALMIPAGLPFVTFVELGEAIDALDTAPVVIAAAGHDGGPIFSPSPSPPANWKGLRNDDLLPGRVPAGRQAQP